ncbi:unnamed protein product [Leptidea sinapis]|uniref:Scavenger receptor class B member 1 n=2 Tax=Leptidea sinapis TaxID=189913 RepID=A0A5E4QYN6_9NEOP|nr:unnamed protein product [Leptidea sinapis]
MTLTANGTVSHMGLEGKQFIANDSLFDNGHKYPEMACYCDEPRDNNCPPAGAFNVSACRFGAPAFVTRPHFLGLEPYYPNKIRGLNPTENHNFKMAIEMNTGMPLSISAQLQANALVRRIPGMSLNNQLPDPDTLVPMFWFREEVLVNEEYVNFAKSALSAKFDIPYAFYASIVIGSTLLAVGLWSRKRSRCQISKSKPRDFDPAVTQTFLKKDPR